METEKKKKNTVTKRVIQALTVILIFVGLFVAVFSMGDITTLGDILRNVNIKFLLIALGLTIIYFVFMVLPHFLIAVMNKTKMDKTRLFINASNEFFFNAITPAQSGSQPFHTLIYLKHGVTSDEASSILTTTYINYQVVANMLSTVALVILALFHSHVLQGRLVIVIIGFILNFAVLVLIFFLTFSKKFPRQVQKFLYFLAKFKPFREKLTKVADETPQIVRKFQKSTRETLKKKRFIILTTIVRIIALLAFYSIPFFVALALNIEIGANEFLYMMAISLVATTLMAWFPLPGSSGGVEAVFVILLTALPAINQTAGLAIMLITRLLTFYLGMLWGALALGILKLMDMFKDRAIKKYQEQVKLNESGKLKVALLCDSYHDNLEAKHIYQELLDNNQYPVIVTHTKHEDNPDDTVYIKISKLRVLRKLKSNNYFLLGSNYRTLKKHKFDIIHFVNALSHSRLPQYIKKFSDLPIIITDNKTYLEQNEYNYAQRINIMYRFEKMILTADRVLPTSLINNQFYHRNKFKPAYIIDPSLFTINDFNSLKATHDRTIDNVKLLEKQFKYRFLLAFADNEEERFIDFYFGIKDYSDLFIDYQFIILGNLKLPKSLLRSLEKNNFDNNFIFIDDYEYATSYMPVVDGYIKEEYSAITSIFYLAALANNKNALLPDGVLLPMEFNELSSIYKYNYANNFQSQLIASSTDVYDDQETLQKYFDQTTGVKLTKLYQKVANEK